MKKHIQYKAICWGLFLFSIVLYNFTVPGRFTVVMDIPALFPFVVQAQRPLMMLMTGSLLAFAFFKQLASKEETRLTDAAETEEEKQAIRDRSVLLHRVYRFFSRLPMEAFGVAYSPLYFFRLVSLMMGHNAPPWGFSVLMIMLWIVVMSVSAYYFYEGFTALRAFQQSEQAEKSTVND